MFGINYLKASPTQYVIHYQNGKIIHEGVGLAFFYYAPSSSIALVPVASADAPFIFNETTGDFQGVTVQGQITYRISDPKRGVDLLEQVLGALPACDYGLWPNGTDLIFKQKITGGGRIQPEYVDLYDLPANGETAADLDRPDHQVGRIATGDNLQRTFARIHDYIYGNQGLKKDAAYWQVLNLIFCKTYEIRKWHGFGCADHTSSPQWMRCKSTVIGACWCGG